MHMNRFQDICDSWFVLGDEAQKKWKKFSTLIFYYKISVIAWILMVPLPSARFCLTQAKARKRKLVNRHTDRKSRHFSASLQGKYTKKFYENHQSLLWQFMRKLFGISPKSCTQFSNRSSTHIEENNQHIVQLKKQCGTLFFYH